MDFMRRAPYGFVRIMKSMSRMNCMRLVDATVPGRRIDGIDAIRGIDVGFRGAKGDKVFCGPP
jgi:hypothetical protein